MKTANKTNSAQIIKALGGSAKLARILSAEIGIVNSIPASTVRAWKHRGIPAKIQLAHPSLIKKGFRLMAKEKASCENLVEGFA